MQVRKFEAPTMNEALQIVKQELGPDAIILSTKNHRKGFGLLSKASVEVTAAISEKSLGKKTLTERVVNEESKNQIRKMPATKQAEVYDGFDDYIRGKHEKKREDQKNRDELEAIKARANSRPGRYVEIEESGEVSRGKVSQAPQKISPAYGRSGKFESESVPNADIPPQGAARFSVDYFSSVLAGDEFNAKKGSDSDDVREEVRRLKLVIEDLKSEQASISDSRTISKKGEEYEEEFQKLLLNGVDRKVAAKILKMASNRLSREEMHNQRKITEALALEMMEMLRVENIMDFRSGSGQRTYAIVGPTGVGKTTTIAKIAAQAVLHMNLRVGLINVDTYKVAAVDQLATYAKILNVPFRQATNTLELERALNEFKPLDLVLIDTSGHSQKDAEGMANAKKLLESIPAIRSLLIMSATTRDQELYDILSRFSAYHPSGLLFSKLDEATVFGCLLNICSRTNLPMTYFTVGQRVPEDVELASKERVVDLILDL